MQTDNPALIRLFRGGQLESIHRGAWALVESSGRVIDQLGDADQMIYPRSAMKSLQALPLLESGAFERFGFDDRHLALAIASHSGEAEHITIANDGLAKLGLDSTNLQCGSQRPMHSSPEVKATAASHNCSGKHVGFLAVALQLGGDVEHYLDPDAEGQRLVLDAVTEITDAASLDIGIDGCSAPTFRMSLTALATGMARIANPGQLIEHRATAARRVTEAARMHPSLVAGSHERFCTDLLRATDGRIFGKIGAEGVYAFGVVGADLGFAGKADDGNARGLYPVMIDLLRRRGLLSDQEHSALHPWSDLELLNSAGAVVGHVEIC